jgi:HK97 gp10 family phage protein
MSDFTVEIKPDGKAIVIGINKFFIDHSKDIHKRLVQGGNEIRNEIIKSMQKTPKTGKKYKRGKKFHIASSPGNPPAKDKGELIRSIIMSDRQAEIEVGSKGGAPYSKLLEEGTMKMAKRPFLKPAVEKIMPNIIKRIKDDIRKFGQ